MSTCLPAADQQLIQIVDAALAEGIRRGGSWVVCRPGCTSCCLGPFPITALDSLRLEEGMRQLGGADPERAASVRLRAAAYVEALGPGGEPLDIEALPSAFDDLPCPALDPQSGCCDLYEWRPITCRQFGPAARISSPGGISIAACELCYHGATEEEIAACAVDPDPQGLEQTLVGELTAGGRASPSLVAFALCEAS